MKCGDCENMGHCTHRKPDDDIEGCKMFYADVYMMVNHPEVFEQSSLTSEECLSHMG